MPADKLKEVVRIIEEAEVLLTLQQKEGSKENDEEVRFQES